MSEWGISGTRRGGSAGQIAHLIYRLQGLQSLQPTTGSQPILRHGCCKGIDEQAVLIAYTLGGIMIVGHPPTNRRFISEMACDLSFQLEDPKDYLERNHNIVDAVNFLLVVPRSNREEFRGSGTWSTLRYAKSIGRGVEIIER